jgi:hypothetical protein
MKFKIEIACGNAAFADLDCGSEIARILRSAAEEAVDLSEPEVANWEPISLYDINGNKVGRAWVEK